MLMRFLTRRSAAPIDTRALSTEHGSLLSRGASADSVNPTTPIVERKHRPMPDNHDPEGGVVHAGPLARLARLSLKRVRPADLFDAWLFAETEAALALAAWRSARTAEKADAHAAYRAALDREAQAAELLELRLARAGG
jgi:hypothetical protein